MLPTALIVVHVVEYATPVLLGPVGGVQVMANAALTSALEVPFWANRGIGAAALPVVTVETGARLPVTVPIPPPISPVTPKKTGKSKFSRRAGSAVLTSQLAVPAPPLR
jgi:hypothetical protein